MNAVKSPSVAALATGEWENGGGALALDNRTLLPDDVIAVQVTHYRVGQYRYTDLGDAMAQHHRQTCAVTAENGDQVSRNRTS